MSTKTNRLRERYLKDVVPALSKEFEFEIKSQIESRLPASLVEGVRVIDFAFDARI